jgi:hypothetical protein
LKNFLQLVLQLTGAKGYVLHQNLFILSRKERA